MKTGQYTQRHVVFAGEFHRTNLQHLGTQAGHFQHFLEGDAVQTAGGVHDPRVGGVNPVHIGVDLALVGFERRRQGHRGGVRAAPAQGGDVAVLVDALEAGHHAHPAGVEIGAHLAVVDLFNAGLGVGVVGADGDLAAGVGTGAHVELLQRHGQQRDGDLLAGGDQHVHLPRRRVVVHAVGQFDQAVGFTAHGGDHHDHLITTFPEARHPFGDGLNAFDGAYRGAAVFLDN